MNGNRQISLCDDLANQRSIDPPRNCVGLVDAGHRFRTAATSGQATSPCATSGTKAFSGLPQLHYVMRPNSAVAPSARMKIGTANLAYNFKRLVWHYRTTAPAYCQNRLENRAITAE